MNSPLIADKNNTILSEWRAKNFEQERENRYNTRFIMHKQYVHGYSAREAVRLVDQAVTLTELLHGDTHYSAGSTVLEAGCGVGAQTVTLAKNSPQARITSVDISEASLAEAQKRVQEKGFRNVTFQHGDLFHLPFAPASFDHVFICFVLEHLADPAGALACLRKVLKPGGSITVIEGDHGSTFFHPRNAASDRAVQCLVELQARGGGDALIGRRLYPLLSAAGYKDVRVSPRMVYADASKPELVDGFTRKTFTAMVEGVREAALGAGLMDVKTWEEGVRGLNRSAEQDGTFCYTFFKAVGTN
jgi:2-polyprenyl-3-methyl-5-hydroxy-6-metoxy-1,4-benzoquinol methylase